MEDSKGKKISLEFPSDIELQSLEQFLPKRQFPKKIVERLSRPTTLDQKHIEFWEGVTWENHLLNKLGKCNHALMLAQFYFVKGSHVQNKSIDLEDSAKNLRLDQELNVQPWKLQFEFYAETFYLQIFSAWDLFAQVIHNCLFTGKKSTAVHFSELFKELADFQNLRQKATAIKGDTKFGTAKEYRERIAHRLSPMIEGFFVNKKPGDREKFEELKKVMPSLEGYKAGDTYCFGIKPERASEGAVFDAMKSFWDFSLAEMEEFVNLAVDSLPKR